MKKIKVAQVITRLDRGGSPDIYRILASHLDPNVYEVTLITGPTRHPAEKVQRFLKGFKGRVILIPSLRRDINPILDTAAFLKLLSLCMRQRFDIVHTHTAKAGALGRLAARLSGTPVIVHTPHGHNFYGYFGPQASAVVIYIERMLTRLTDRIIALTELEKKDNIAFNVAADSKIDVIRQGLELGAYAPDAGRAADLKKALGIAAGENVVGMVGRLEPVKGSRYFIEAAAIVVKAVPQTKFIVVGEGGLRAELEKRTRELGIDSHVVFTGWREDVPALLSVMDLLVMPSRNEAVGMALIEAQARGIPVVATNVGGIPEVVENGRTGLLVGPDDAAALAGAITQLISDPARRLAMGAEARAWVAGKFDADTMAARISDLYMELLKQKVSRTAGGR